MTVLPTPYRIALTALGVILLGLLPLVVHNNYWLSILVFVAIYTILAVGLNLLMGYAGQISLGHAAFFGIGAYSSAILTTQWHWSPWLALVCGLLLTALVALLIGIPCLRLRGHYLAMATLGFGWIVFIVMKQWSAVTQGTSGIESIPKLAIGTLVFDSDIRHYYLVWGIAILVLVISANLVNSRIGRALRAVHGSEMAAAALGVDIARSKIQVFVLSAVYAALAGSLYAHVVNFINPTTFGFHISVSLVVMVVIGGMASIWGAPLGAASITLLIEWLRNLPFKDIDVIAHGLILILVMIFMPGGVVCGLQDIIQRVLRRKIRRATAPARLPAPEGGMQ